MKAVGMSESTEEARATAQLETLTATNKFISTTIHREQIDGSRTQKNLNCFRY